MRKALTIFGALILLAGASYLLGWSSLLTVKNIVVVGALDTQGSLQIENMSDIHPGEKLARRETRVVAGALSKVSWVESSRVNRNWFNGKVTITVWPRIPIARYTSSYIDKNGVEFSLPNISTAKIPVVETSDVEGLKFAAKLLTSLPTSMVSELQSLRTRGSSSATLSILHRSLPLELAWGDDTETALKVQVYQALLALPENSRISFMDVSAPHAPIVK